MSAKLEEYSEDKEKKHDRSLHAAHAYTAHTTYIRRDTR